MQLNDGIFAVSLNHIDGWEEICNGQNMVRRHLVRGYKDHIFIAKISENTEKIFEVKLSASSVEELTQTEIYQHVGGKMAAFESDY